MLLNGPSAHRPSAGAPAPLASALTVAGLAVLAGASVIGAFQRPPVAPVRSERVAATPALQPAGVQDVLRLARRPGARVALVNVWATWCVPCREELPDLLRVEREYRDRGLRVILVSADFGDAAAAARSFLGGLGVGFQTYLKTGSDMEFIDGLSPKWSGALPATFLFDGSGSLRDFWVGRTTYETFAGRVGALLGAPPVGGGKG
jgi:thiol-disulfide isomerase/thioredoxin